MPPFEIITADVVEWAKNYRGPLFHSLGPCDPPYHLTSIAKRFGKPGAAPAQHGSDGAFARASAGFMGQTWDGGDIAFRPETWAAFLPLLHPGSFGMAFAGSRGWHRLAAAIEDAGYIIHPSIFGWLYGCLSEDTELLTEAGWRSGKSVQVGDRAVAWDSATGELRLEEIEHVFLAPYDGTMVWLHNDDTDQLLTPNHRVFCRPYHRKQQDGKRRVEKGGWTVNAAEEMASLLRFDLPLAGTHAGSGIGGDDYARLLAWVWTDGGFDKTKRSNGVRIYQSSSNPEHIVSIQGILNRLNVPHRKYVRERAYRDQTYVEHLWFISRDWARRIRTDLPQKRPTFDLLWRMSLREKRAFLDAAMAGDGSGTAFYQKAEGDRDWFQALALCSEKHSRRGSKCSIALRNSTTTQFQARHLAQTEAIYRGYVWCVTVPSGAFVARRGGKPFITGNSGFPKATRIDTQIDREAGAEREVVGEQPVSGYTKANVDQGAQGRETWQFPKTVAATDLAKTWEHHRYGLQALKPALEPIIVFQKPYEGRPIDDITRTGAGALNVDGGRIASDGEHGTRGRRVFSGFSSGDRGNFLTNGMREQKSPENAAGRWPANFALAHAPECVSLGLARSRSPGMKTSDARKSFGKPPSNDAVVHAGSEVVRTPGYADSDGLETVERWACVPECPVRRLNNQAGRLASGNLTSGQQLRGGFAGANSGTIYGSAKRGGLGDYQDNAGYASRFFFTAVEAALTEADVVQYEEKAGQEERERGLRGVFRCLMDGKAGIRHDVDTLWSESHFVIRDDGPEVEVNCRRNPHPTVKPIDLIRWLATLLLPPEAYAPRRILIPFAGVGSEVIGARQAGWDEVVGVELHERYAAIGRQRLAGHLGMF